MAFTDLGHPIPLDDHDMPRDLEIPIEEVRTLSPRDRLKKQFTAFKLRTMNFHRFSFFHFRREIFVCQGDRDTYIGNNTIDYVQERRIGRSRYRVPYRDLNKCMWKSFGLGQFSMDLRFRPTEKLV